MELGRLSRSCFYVAPGVYLIVLTFVRGANALWSGMSEVWMYLFGLTCVSCAQLLCSALIVIAFKGRRVVVVAKIAGAVCAFPLFFVTLFYAPYLIPYPSAPFGMRAVIGVGWTGMLGVAACLYGVQRYYRARE